MDSAPAQLALQKRLNETFSETQLRNPAFSLRAFARRLEVSPSALSEILKGKRRVSKKLAGRVVGNLCLGPIESRRLLELFPEHPQRRGTQTEYQSPYVELGIDQFHVMTEWYHFGILSLSQTFDFEDTPAWVAKRLNIRESDAQDALERLERTGLLKRELNGKLRPTNRDYSTTDGVSDVSIRRAHATNLELARRSLENDLIDNRDFTATTMAIDLKKLPMAKKMIREFHDKLCAYLESGKRSEVYKLSVQMIPLSVRKQEAQ